MELFPTNDERLVAVGRLLIASVTNAGAKGRDMWQWCAGLPWVPHVLDGSSTAIGDEAGRGDDGFDVRELTANVRVLYGRLNNTLLKWFYRIPLRQGKQHIRKTDDSYGRQSSRKEAQLAWNQGLVYEKSLDPQSAIACLELATRLQPHNLDYIARLAKQWTDMSFSPGVSTQRARELNKQALFIAEKILEKDPKHLTGTIALCVSKGRLAFFSDNRAKVHLAKEAEDLARHGLQLAPKNDLFHHLMGRWHFEMAGLNVLARTFVRIVYGALLHPGSYHGALREFEEASRLAPYRVIHHIQLGKTHWKLGNKEEARKALEHALELEITDLNDYLEMESGCALLRKIKGRKVHIEDFEKTLAPVAVTQMIVPVPITQIAEK